MGTDTPTAAIVPESAAVLPAGSAPALPAAAPSRVQLLLCLSAFLAALNFFAPTPFYPQMARDLQTTVPLLGQVVTLMALISAGLGLFIGPLADRYGYRWPLVMGLLAIAAGLLGTGLTEMQPGSIKGLQMVVPNIQEARDELLRRGAEVSEIEVLPWGSFVFFSDPDGNSWALQQIPDRG